MWEFIYLVIILACEKFIYTCLGINKLVVMMSSSSSGAILVAILCFLFCLCWIAAMLVQKEEKARRGWGWLWWVQSN